MRITILSFFCRCLPHVELSMKNKHESRMSHPNALLKHFYVVPWNSAYFNSCHDGHAEVFGLRQSNSYSLLWASNVFTCSFYHLHLSGIRSWFSFGNHLSLGHVVLVKWLQCPTYSETRIIFSKICFCKIYSF